MNDTISKNVWEIGGLLMAKFSAHFHSFSGFSFFTTHQRWATEDAFEGNRVPGVGRAGRADIR